MAAVVFVAFMVAALCAIVIVAVVSWTNPVTNVADELRSPLSASEVESLVVPVLTSSPKVDVAMVLPGTYTMSYRSTPLIAWLLAVVAFPIGLLAVWFLRETQSLTVTIMSEPDGSRVRVFGRAHEKLAVALGDALQIQSGGVATRV